MLAETTTRVLPPGGVAFGSPLNGTTTRPAPRWLHWWAVLTVCAACPLLVAGAEVTTLQVGMVDPQGFRAPWLLFDQLREGSLFEPGLGYLVEHGHRLAGFTVGSCVIVLALGLGLADPRPRVRWLGLAALLAVSAQGVLGIFRVNLNALMGGNLALLHGCFAHLVLALLVSLALFTSRRWQQEPSGTAGATARLRRWSLLALGLVYAQLVFGAFVRHRDSAFGARLHLLLAFAVVAAVVWLIREVLANPQRSRQETVAALVLAGLLVLQLALGTEAWLSKFGPPAALDRRALTPERELLIGMVRSLHYLVGSLVFSATLVVALRAHRRLGWLGLPAPAGRAEGAA